MDDGGGELHSELVITVAALRGKPRQPLSHNTAKYSKNAKRTIAANSIVE